MSFFDLDPTATQNVMDQARMNPLTADDLKPGWWAGAWKAPVTGLASAVNDAALLAGDAGTPVARAMVRPIDDMFKTKLDEWLVGEQQKAVDNIKQWAPDPRTTGVIGQTVHGLFNVIPEVIAGGPEVAGVLQGYKGFRGGMADGLDPGTAFGKGAIDGISTWVGLKMPMSLGPTAGAAKNIAFGAAVNVPVGMASRGATGALLEARGYPEMASQYQVLDNAAIATDLIMGAGFGALAHYGPGALAKYEVWRKHNKDKMLPSDMDTALGLNNQLHLELDTAPGIPTDMATRAAHVEAVHSAIESLLKGDPVMVDSAVTRGEFTDNPSATRTREDVRTVVEEHMGAEWKVFEEQLRERGLPLDDIDQSGIVRVARETEPAPSAPKPAEGETAPPKSETAAAIPEGEKPAAPADTITRILNERTDMTIPDGQGNPLPAHEVLAQSDAEIASAKQDAQGFDAAVACALRG